MMCEYSLSQLKIVNSAAYDKFIAGLNPLYKFVLCDDKLSCTVLSSKRTDFFNWSGTGWTWWCEYDV